MEAEIIKPKLVESGTKLFLNNVLKNCNQFRTKYINLIFNTFLFLGFVFVVFIILYFKYRGKITDEEKREREEKQKYYILSKIKNYQVNKLKQQNNLISNLPYFDDLYQPYM